MRTSEHGSTEKQVGEGIHPYKINVSQVELDDLETKLSLVRWPDDLPDVGWTRGVPVAYLQKLVAHWHSEHNWREHEERMNQYPQFITRIDGQNVHFLHVRSPEPNALPLMLIHGWPGSIVEFLELIGPLTDPRSYGGDPQDAFHLVIPSLPGHGFSGPITETGWTDAKVAQGASDADERARL